MSSPSAPHGKNGQLVHFVDLDGTLAFWDTWRGGNHIGEPIEAMADKVRAWLVAGDRVVIYTARACSWNDFPWAEPDDNPITDRAAAIRIVQDWTEKHFGQRLEVVGGKGPWDHAYDDKTYRIVRNTGKTVEEHVLEFIQKRRTDLRWWHSTIDVLDELEAFVRGL